MQFNELLDDYLHIDHKRGVLQHVIQYLDSLAGHRDAVDPGERGDPARIRAVRHVRNRLVEEKDRLAQEMREIEGVQMKRRKKWGNK